MPIPASILIGAAFFLPGVIYLQIVFLIGISRRRSFLDTGVSSFVGDVLYVLRHDMLFPEGFKKVTRWGAMFIVFIGVMIFFLGQVVESFKTNNWCVESCQNDSFKGGRVRGNPHVPVNETGPPGCWCYSESHASPVWNKEETKKKL